MSSAPAYPAPGTRADEDRAPAFLAYSIVTIIVAILAVVLRFWSRALSSPKTSLMPRFWWDDWMALAALFPAMVNQGIKYAMIRLGLGKHIWNVPRQNITHIMKIIFIQYYFFDLALTLAKASALLFYSRVFSARTSPLWFKLCIWTLHTLNVGWCVGNMIGGLVFCDPIRKNWDFTAEGHCGSQRASWLGNAIPSAAIDFLILLVPMPMIWRLNLSRQRKILLMFVFIFGYSTVAISIGRLVATIRYQKRFQYDFTYEFIPVNYWLTTEVPITLLSACVPAMFKIARRVMNDFTPLASKIKSLFSSSSLDKSESGGSDLDDLRRGSDEKKVARDERSRGLAYNAAGYRVYASHDGSIETDLQSTTDVSEIEEVHHGIVVKNAVTVVRESSETP